MKKITINNITMEFSYSVEGVAVPSYFITIEKARDKEKFIDNLFRSANKFCADNDEGIDIKCSECMSFEFDNYIIEYVDGIFTFNVFNDFRDAEQLLYSDKQKYNELLDTELENFKELIKKFIDEENTFKQKLIDAMDKNKISILPKYPFELSLDELLDTKEVEKYCKWCIENFNDIIEFNK